MSQQWITVTESAFPWERAALSYLRERLPEQEPFRAWANFEFIADDGSINEVDLLVVSLYKLYLVEIKSRPGQVSGDTSTWTWTHEGRVSTDDNPLLLANRKAKKLKALLQRQKALHGQRLPYVDNIRAGTPPYLEPSLRRRTLPRWDLYAERFAIAMTLYEMATGVLPQWGDGQSDPATLDCEVSLDSALFDPAVRDALSAFFARALHSDYHQRFDNAEDMRRAWQRVFASVDQPNTATDHGPGIDVERALMAATEATPLSTLGLSPRVLDALARIGAQTIGELLRLPRIRLYRNQGG